MTGAIEEAMGVGRWQRPRRRLAIVFASVALGLAVALGLLGRRFLQQERALATQAVQDRLEQAADRAAAELLRRLADAQRQLAVLAALPESAAGTEATAYAQGVGSDVVILTLDRHGLAAHPPARLLYYPYEPAAAKAPRDRFQTGERYEFRERDYRRAIDAFENVARTRDRTVRAEALLRIGRVWRKAREPDSALVAYAELASLGDTPVAGAPAALVARHARCEVLGEARRASEREREAQALYADLHAGRWRLGRATWEFYAGQLGAWLHAGAAAAPPDSGERTGRALAEGAAWMWRQAGAASDRGPAQGWQTLWLDEQPVLALWHRSGERTVALLGGAGLASRDWLARLRPWLDGQSVRVTLSDPSGHAVLGSGTEGSGRAAVRTAADLRLPWTVRAASADPEADVAGFATRQRLLLTSMLFVGGLFVVSLYLIARAVTRELAAARLQSDFVAAVSHEFRTPLTSMRQLTELLAGDRVPGEARRAQYYDVLKRETERLHRLVESLLDFGRMEAGAREFRFEPVDLGQLVRDLVEDFRQEQTAERERVRFSAAGAGAMVRADPDALRRAIWNLLDNAVKYSPASEPVTVGVAATDGKVAIWVRDRGVGIPADERERVFQKFERGAAAKASGIQGTGIGLAMVRHIIDAHGGALEVESEPAGGSTFTIRLPTASQP